MKQKIDEEVLDQIAQRLRAMGSPLRLRVLHALEGGELSVGEIVEEVGSQQATVSNQLRVLWHAGLVTRRREGLAVYYGLSDQRMLEVCRTLCDTLSSTLLRKLDSIERGRRAILGSARAGRPRVATRAK